jgi:hypothetical protein
MKLKTLFRGAFNYRQTAKVLYAYAFTERQAWAIMCRRLAEKDGVHPSVVMNLFDSSRPNFEITIETEFKEDL